MRPGAMLANLRKWFLQGIALVAPLAITIAFLFWLGRSVELFMGDLLRTLLPPEWDIPGMGLLAGVLLTLAAGLMANLFLVRWLLRLTEGVLDHIPLVKSLFQGLKDIARFFSKEGDSTLGRAVTVEIQGARLVGFVMQEHAVLPGELADGLEERRIAVYLPMSYQVGGYTLYLDRDRVTPLDVSAEDAMRAVLTGGSLSHGELPPKANVPPAIAKRLPFR